MLPAVLDSVHGSPKLRKERKVVTVLFADLVGFTSRAEEGELELRIAFNTGEALVNLEARPEAGEGMAAGDVVNTTARLQSAAPVNGILAGEGDLEQARRLYADGARGWHEFGCPSESAYALPGEGRCLLALGRTDGAGVRLLEARDIAGTLGARPLVAEADALVAEAAASS